MNRPMAYAALCVLTLGASGRSFSADSLTDEARRLIGSGAPVIIRMARDVGTLHAGSRYVVQFDAAGQQLNVSAVQGRKIAGSPATAELFSEGLNFWGASFRWFDGEGCLVQARPAANICAAHYVGPLVPDAFQPPGLIAAAARQATIQIQQHLLNPGAVITRSKPCPTKPGVVQKHLADRYLAESLRINGLVAPFVTEPAARAALEKNLDEGISHLLATSPPTARTTYTQCYGGIDIITPFLVTRALEAHYRLKPRSDIPAYFARLWPQLVADGAVAANGEKNAGSGLVVANGFAAYMHMAAIMEGHGIRAFQPFTYKGLDNLLREQTPQGGQACRDTTGSYRLVAGSWPHGTTECSQNMGYHDFIVGALIAMRRRLEANGACADWCRRIDAALDSALGWIAATATDTATASLTDRAKGSSSTPSKPGSGDAQGAQAGFMIIAERGGPAAMRALLARALDSVLRARTSLVPAAAYLRAQAARPLRAAAGRP